MKAKSADLYLLLEKEVRTPKETILLDAFLPEAAAIPTAFAEPKPPAAEAAAPEGASLSQILGRAAPGEEPEPTPSPRRRKAKPKTAQTRTLEEEIAEFMNRDNSALAPDKDPETS